MARLWLAVRRMRQSCLKFWGKDTTKNWEWGQNDEKSVRMSGLIDLVGFSVQTTDATEKSVEARVSLLSRYSFRWRGGLKSPWGNGCKLSEYSVSGGKVRVISDVACGKRTKKTWSGCDCADVLRFAYSLSALQKLILQLKNVEYGINRESLLLAKKLFSELLWFE